MFKKLWKQTLKNPKQLWKTKDTENPKTLSKTKQKPWRPQKTLKQQLHFGSFIAQKPKSAAPTSQTKILGWQSYPTSCKTLRFESKQLAVDFWTHHNAPNKNYTNKLGCLIFLKYWKLCFATFYTQNSPLEAAHLSWGVVMWDNILHCLRFLWCSLHQNITYLPHFILDCVVIILHT